MAREKKVNSPLDKVLQEPIKIPALDTFRAVQESIDQFKPMENIWRGPLEIPGLEAIRAVQKSIDQFKPTGMDSFIDLSSRMQELFPPIDYTKDFVFIDPPSMNWFKEIHAPFENIQKIINQVNRVHELFVDLNYDDDLEESAFELLPAPELIVPEQKIIIANQVSHIENIIASIYKDHQALHHIHHREFEEMIAELLKSRGFDVHVTKQTRDGGTDIIALQDMAGLPMKFLVECKKYAPHRKIGVDIIRGFSHVINTQRANKGIIFTTSYFTADAEKEKQSYMPYLLDLKDQDDILDWVRKYVE